MTARTRRDALPAARRSSARQQTDEIADVVAHLRCRAGTARGLSLGLALATPPETWWPCTDVSSTRVRLGTSWTVSRLALIPAAGSTSGYVYAHQLAMRSTYRLSTLQTIVAAVTRGGGRGRQDQRGAKKLREVIWAHVTRARMSVGKDEGWLQLAIASCLCAPSPQPPPPPPWPLLPSSPRSSSSTTRASTPRRNPAPTSPQPALAPALAAVVPPIIAILARIGDVGPGLRAAAWPASSTPPPPPSTMPPPPPLPVAPAPPSTPAFSILRPPPPVSSPSPSFPPPRPPDRSASLAFFPSPSISPP
ncbi:hypothetical protein BOTBODRAFT_411157 [Botryobasidium botryosum FD-172 SS1]|uniref:Uncharacterized protein n=1 Tax=Botryobasidium botryosum (strain FD-172 SS1) TaxID=930990 RepID=A0A067MDR6_BOTB1|nr:hypothetical protein BOTBODRAFT_411157 [Botryobasidium botryosum FD-172 SS1]